MKRPYSTKESSLPEILLISTIGIALVARLIEYLYNYLPAATSTAGNCGIVA